MAVAVLCLGGAAPVAAAGPRACGECGGCKKRRCKFDDNCFYDATARTCQDVGADVCRGIQRDHGKKAPADTGGRGGKKKRCPATPVAVDGFESRCVCLNKERKPSRLKKNGRPKKCRFCSMVELLGPSWRRLRNGPGTLCRGGTGGRGPCRPPLPSACLVVTERP